MNELFKLNKKFLIKGYLWMSGILTLGFSLFLISFYSDFPKKWILVIYSLTLIFLPSFILFVWISDWKRKRKYKNRITSQLPYSGLRKIGFDKKIIKPNHNSLVDYVTFARINDSDIIFDIDINRPKVAIFTIYATTNHLNTEDFLRKMDELHHLNIKFRDYYFAREIHTKKEKINSIQELEKILIEFTHIVKKVKYNPIPITEWENL